ncbi:hypothetical protein CMV_029258 [Castanea mollissima]|uniref:Uncharacterized protein n=1 Tax=Castanea mollissima TaxID=60419 RepID=A0A8J4Q5I6_9ROSI|nr:hypothetical protein CMV_029258 [Castanea mollissima]
MQNAAQRLHLQSKTQATISPSFPQLNVSTFSGTTLLQLYICLRYPSLTHNTNPTTGPSVAEGVTAFSVVIIGHLASLGPSP